MVSIVAQVNYNIVLHFGHLRNLNLSSRGIYYVKVVARKISVEEFLSVSKSNTTINQEVNTPLTPIGCFAFPSSFDAKISDTDLLCPFPTQNGYVEDSDSSYRSRSIVVRYRDEIHELNDGVHWKVSSKTQSFTSYTIPTLPIFEDMLILTFDLMHSPLIDDPSVNILTDIEQLIPASPEFKCLSSQSLALQCIRSGFHEYFPITFGTNSIHLDSMIHCGATSISYRVARAPWITTKEKNSSDIQDNYSTSEKPSQNYDTNTNFSSSNSSKFNDLTIDSIPYSENYNSLESPSIYNPFPPYQSSWEEENVEYEVTEDLSRFTHEDVLDLFALYSALAIRNYEMLHDSVAELGDIIDDHFMSQYCSRKERLTLINKHVKDHEHDFQLVCYLTAYRSEIISDVLSADSKINAVRILDLAMERYNNELSKIWFEFVSSIRKGMLVVRDLLKLEFDIKMRRFWKRQVVTQTCSPVYTRKPHPEGESLFSYLTDQLLYEESLVYASRNRNMARDLNVFDTDIHLAVSRLPVILLQQYLTNNNSGDQSNSLDSVSYEESAIRGGFIMNNIFDISTSKQEDVITSSMLVASSLLSPSNQSQWRSNIFNNSPISQQFQSGNLPVDVSTEDHRLKAVDPARFAPPTKLNVFQSPLLLVKQSEIFRLPNDPADIKKMLVFSANDLPSQMTSPPKSLDENLKLKQSASTLSTETDDPLIWRDHQHRWKPLLKPSYYEPQAMSIYQLAALNASSLNDANKLPSEFHTHLVVLVHGFQGHSRDMRLFASALQIAIPNVKVLCARSNEVRNEDSISTMANRLVEELIKYCKESAPELLHESSMSRISFVGYSMGGLVIRKALENNALAPLLPKLNAFISLSCPHLGSLLSDSQLVTAGMWAMSLLKRNRCVPLRELVLEDSLTGRLSQSLIYKLSENASLTRFRKVILVSSVKDQYVPSYSARIQVPKSTADVNLGSLLEEMVANILSQIDNSKLFRLIVDNNTSGDINVDTMIGRSAHISYLENAAFVNQLVYTIYPLIV